MDLVFALRMRTASRVADTGDRDTRKKVRVDHLYAQRISNVKGGL
jgi:hypothetical protein